MIDFWERPVEVAKWLYLILSVLHDDTAQNNPPSLEFSLDVYNASPDPPGPGTACHLAWRRCREVAAPHAKMG